MKKMIFTSAKSENTKALFVLQYTMHADASTILETSSETEARAAYESEVAKLKDVEPADTGEWTDYDQAWSDVYQIELVKYVMNEDDEVEDVETLEISDYYYL